MDTIKSIGRAIGDSFKSDKYFWIFLLVMFPLMLYSNYASGETATGASRYTKTSLLNSYVSAHFKCNRKGLWADLDTLEVKDVSRFTYTIAGGRVRTTEVRTLVEFKCTPKYKKAPAELLEGIK